METLGQRHTRYADIGQTVGAMTAQTGQMYVPLAVARIVVMADAVFLRPLPVVYLVKQMGFGEQRQRAEQRRTVYRRHHCLKVGQAESIAELVPDVSPDHQPDGRHPHSGMYQCLFV